MSFNFLEQDNKKEDQTTAVVRIITSLCDQRGYKHEVGKTVYRDILTNTDRKIILEQVSLGFKLGNINITKTYTTESAIRSYASILIADRLNKCSKLNGSLKYLTQEKSVKTPEIKNLELYKQTLADPAKIAEVEKYIQTLIEKEKLKAIQSKVNMDAIPEHLK